MNITGISAVVTGAGSGLGAATAQALLQAGAKVALLDLNIHRAKAVAQQFGGHAVYCDVADPASASVALAQAVGLNGAFRVLVNCAAISIGRISLVGNDPFKRLKAFSRQMDVNLNGALNMLSLSADVMAAQAPLYGNERGVIISTASIAAYEGSAGSAAYSASKGGVAAMTLPAARELSALGIRVNTIAPGIFETPMMQGLPAYVRESYNKDAVFPRRFGDAAEFADLVLHLVHNTMINGAVIRLDGALRLPADADFLSRCGAPAS